MTHHRTCLRCTKLHSNEMQINVSLANEAYIRAYNSWCPPAIITIVVVIRRLETIWIAYKRHFKVYHINMTFELNEQRRFSFQFSSSVLFLTMFQLFNRRQIKCECELRKMPVVRGEYTIYTTTTTTTIQTVIKEHA